MSQKKKPDHIVYNEETNEYDAKKKEYPTSLSAPSFKPVVQDNTNSIKASKYFKSKMDEIKAEYDNLMNEYEWTTTVYNAECNFEPIMGETYHLYEKGDIYFLSLIEPQLWKQKHYGSFRLSTDGKWEKIETKE